MNELMIVQNLENVFRQAHELHRSTEKVCYTQVKQNLFEAIKSINETSGDHLVAAISDPSVVLPAANVVVPIKKESKFGNTPPPSPVKKNHRIGGRNFQIPSVVTAEQVYSGEDLEVDVDPMADNPFAEESKNLIDAQIQRGIEKEKAAKAADQIKTVDSLKETLEPISKLQTKEFVSKFKKKGILAIAEQIGLTAAIEEKGLKNVNQIAAFVLQEINNMLETKE